MASNHSFMFCLVHHNVIHPKEQEPKPSCWSKNSACWGQLQPALVSYLLEYFNLCHIGPWPYCLLKIYPRCIQLVYNCHSYSTHSNWLSPQGADTPPPTGQSDGSPCAATAPSSRSLQCIFNGCRHTPQDGAYWMGCPISWTDPRAIQYGTPWTGQSVRLVLLLAIMFEELYSEGLCFWGLNGIFIMYSQLNLQILLDSPHKYKTLLYVNKMHCMSTFCQLNTNISLCGLQKYKSSLYGYLNNFFHTRKKLATFKHYVGNWCDMLSSVSVVKNEGHAVQGQPVLQARPWQCERSLSWSRIPQKLGQEGPNYTNSEVAAALDDFFQPNRTHVGGEWLILCVFCIELN